MLKTTRRKTPPWWLDKNTMKRPRISGRVAVEVSCQVKRGAEKNRFRNNGFRHGRGTSRITVEAAAIRLKREVRSGEWTQDSERR